MWFITSLLAAYQSVSICRPTPETKAMRTKKRTHTEGEKRQGKNTDRMKSSIQTRAVTNREFYELQTCWNGVPCVCGSSYQFASSRGGWELHKNGLIRFPHERVSLGQHQTRQSTQIYGPLKQQAFWPMCHHRLAAETHCTLINSWSQPSIITGQSFLSAHPFIWLTCITCSYSPQSYYSLSHRLWYFAVCWLLSFTPLVK